jgi:uncharacterized protein (TIGR03032 family)
MAVKPTSGLPSVPEIPFRAINSAGLPQLLEAAGICLLVSTYQAGKLMAVRGSEGTIWTLLRSFDRPMGLAAAKDNHRFVLGTRQQIWDFQNAPDIARQIEPIGRHDACFLPRVSYVTGDILAHEMAWADNELWLVNTLFSCLCTIHLDYSFVPRWRPPFVSALLPEDRCHLNGLTIVDGIPKYVTALGETDSLEGWRPNKVDGGILMDIPTGQVIARGLCMPHSPRVYAGHLWILAGGTGQLQVVDANTGKRETVAEFPGFARGLSFHGPYAFVGLSKIRESAMFGGLPVASRVKDLRCGIWVIDVRSGQVVESMQFQSGVEEVFAVQVMSGIRFPEIVGFQEETLSRTYILPPIDSHKTQ